MVEINYGYVPPNMRDFKLESIIKIFFFFFFKNPKKIIDMRILQE